MGWWSVDILGGDTPLDYLGDISDMIGVESLCTESNIVGVKEKLAGLIPKVIDGTLFESDEYEYWTGYQVLAVKLLEYGVSLDGNVKEILISHIEQDDWQDAERVKVIDSLISEIKKHDGEIVKINSRGLFEMLGEAIESGNNGLINK